MNHDNTTIYLLDWASSAFRELRSLPTCACSPALLDIHPIATHWLESRYMWYHVNLYPLQSYKQGNVPATRGNLAYNTPLHAGDTSHLGLRFVGKLRGLGYIEVRHLGILMRATQ